MTACARCGSNHGRLLPVEHTHPVDYSVTRELLCGACRTAEGLTPAFIGHVEARSTALGAPPMKRMTARSRGWL